MSFTTKHSVNEIKDDNYFFQTSLVVFKDVMKLFILSPEKILIEYSKRSINFDRNSNIVIFEFNEHLHKWIKNELIPGYIYGVLPNNDILLRSIKDEDIILRAPLYKEADSNSKCNTV